MISGTSRYRADISAGGLKLPETRVIAGLLLRGVNETEWRTALISDNVLQARNSATAIRLARLIKARLAPMDAELWKMIYEETGLVAVHATLAAAINHSALLGDFLDLIVREQCRLFNSRLSGKLWDDYLSECRARDPGMPEWNESTRRRLRSSVFQSLAQAGFLQSTRTLRLQPVHISQQVLRYLANRDEEYVLRCIQVSP